MSVAVLDGLAEANAVDDGGVIQRVTDDGIFRLHQHLEQTGVSVEAARVQNSVVTSVELGNLLLQIFVNVLRHENRQKQ